MNQRATIALVLYPVVNAVVFGFFAVATMSIPEMAVHARMFLPAAAETGLLVAAPLSWTLAINLSQQGSRRL